MWQKLSLREKRLVIAVAFLGFLAGYYFIVIDGLFPEYVKFSQEVSQLNDEVDLLNSTTAVSSKVHKEKQELEKRLHTIMQKTGINPASGHSFLELLSNLPADLELSGIYPGEISQQEKLLRLPVKLLAVGEQKSITELLNEIEKLPNLSKVDKLSLVKKQDTLLALELEISLYGNDSKKLYNSGHLLNELGKVNAFETLIETTGGTENSEEQITQVIPGETGFTLKTKDAIPKGEDEKILYKEQYRFPVKIR